MSFVKIWVHSVWGTKNRIPVLTSAVRKNIFDHILQNARLKSIYIDSINGYSEHVHCLLALNADMSLSKVMQLIKGESAYWINKNDVIPGKFEWADEYYAVSVNERSLDEVRKYIRNQEEHHRNITFEEEYQKFIAEYQFVGQG